jgi:hypothetical protein
MDIDITVIGDTVVDLVTSNVNLSIDFPIPPEIGISTTSPIVSLAQADEHVVELNMTDYSIGIEPQNASIDVSVIGGGSGGGNRNFKSVDLDITTSGQYTLNAGRQAFLLGYTSMVAGVRIRGYADESFRTLDEYRSLTQNPLMNGGVLFEIVTEVGEHSFSLVVPLYSTSVIPIQIDYPSNPNTTVTFHLL